MKILHRYVGKTVFASIGLVTLMLSGLQMFILFVNQLDDIGKGNYGIIPSAWYVLSQTPFHVYLFFPMACLLGCLIGLGMMANHRELVVMRSAGISIMQITAMISRVALALVLVVTLVGETVIPWLVRHGSDYKMAMISNGQTLRTARGVWLRSKFDFINIGSVLPSNELLNVFQYHFNQQRALVFARKIASVRLEKDHWQAYGVTQTNFLDDKTSQQRWSSMPWGVQVQPKGLKVSMMDPEEMTLPELHRYVRSQKNTQQNAQQYELAFWQRSVQPFTTLVMMLLAIPFIFGPLRSSSMGAKFLAGAAMGFSFHVVNRFFGPISQVYQWPPIMAGVGPTIVFAIIGILLMRRAR